MRPYALALVIGSSFAAANASALTQPNGAPIPSPMGCANNEPTGLEAVMACACTMPGICNIGASCPGGSVTCANGQNGTCEATLWHSPNDNSCIPSNESGVDVSTQARIVPESFHPTCGQTFTVISRGTARFQNVFGWYNATAAGQLPDPSDLHVMIQCTDAPGTATTLDVTTAPGYKGGDIGFFLLTPEDHTAHGTCAAGNCCPSVAGFQSGQGYVYYSQRDLDPDYAAAAPYIHLLLVPSTIEPHRYYFAWEDTFDTTSADFTDLVIAVDGVECGGAGVSCNTGKLGACALGVTECTGGATTPTCQELVQPKPEICNGVDDDCDGVVDNGATCPTPGDQCINGACVAPCGSEVFCGPGLTCDNSKCVAPACASVSCGADQVCRGGTCETACAGVVCPYGQTCVNDVCLDLCAGVTCAASEVCSDGVCFPGCAACGGVTCTAPLSCDSASGGCVDPSCASPCPSGTYCSSGACVPACTGAKCPGGAACTNGQCAPLASASDAGMEAGTLGPPGKPGADGGTGGVMGGHTGGGTDASVGGADAGGFAQSSAGCGCSTPGSRRERMGHVSAWLAAIAMAGVAARRRRRARA